MSGRSPARRGLELEPLATLLQLCDSALPAGGFAHSDGIEQLVADGIVCDAASLQATLTAHRLLTLLPGDACFVEQSHAAACELRHPGRPEERPRELASVAARELAFRPAATQRIASIALGNGLLRAALALSTEDERQALGVVRSNLGPQTPRATTFGAVAATLGVASPAAVDGYVYAVVSGMAQAAVRLAAVSAFESVGCVRAALAAPSAPQLAMPASFSPALDIAAMRHETLEPKLFAS